MEEVLESGKTALYLACYIGGKVDENKPGHIGIGIHGYYVTDELSKRGYGLKNVIPSPNGYRKGEKGDLRVVDNVIDSLTTMEVPKEAATTNACLIKGVVEVLNLALAHHVKSVWIGMARVRLAQTLATGLVKQRKAEFKDAQGIESPYKADMEAFIRAFDMLTELGIPVTIEPVEEVNAGAMLAQNLAELAFLRPVNTETEQRFFSLTAAAGYWNYEHGRHPLLSHPRLLFHSSKKHSGLPEYLYTMDYEKAAADKDDPNKVEIEVGQSLAHARYAVVKPHEIDPLVAFCADRHREFHRLGHSNLAVMYLSAVFSKQGHALLSRFGSDILANTTHLTELVDGRGVVYTHDMPIPRKSMRASLIFTEMEDTLKQFEECYLSNPGDEFYTFDCVKGQVSATAITELLFVSQEDAKGKVKIKPSKFIELPNLTLTVNARLKDHDVDREIPVKMTIGYDMPTRNTISALLDEDFKAFILVYRDTELSVRHMVVIFSQKGCGIWTTPFAARTFTLS